MLFFLDRDFNMVATASNDSPRALPYYNDRMIEQVRAGSASYTVTLPKHHEQAMEVAEGNYLLFKEPNGRQLMFTIMNIEETSTEKTLYAESSGLDLLNEVTGPFQAKEARTLESYLIQVLGDSGWEVGVNEVADRQRILGYTGHATVMERIGHLLNGFGGVEATFTVEFQNNRLTHRYINIYEKIGQDLGLRVEAGKDLVDARRIVDLSDLITGLIGEGAEVEEETDGEEEPVSVITTFKDIVYDDGNFYSPEGDPAIYSREANARWSRFRGADSASNGFIMDYYDYQTESPQELFNRTFNQLEERSEPSITYDIAIDSLGFDVQIGDMLTVVDHDYAPALLLKARVLEKETSRTDPSINRVVLGNFIKLKPTIAERVADLMDRIGGIQEQVERPGVPQIQIESSNGVLFRQGDLVTQLTAKVFMDGVDVTNQQDTSRFEWRKTDKDGTLDSDWGGAGGFTGPNVFVTHEDINQRASISVNVAINNVVYTESITLYKLLESVARPNPPEEPVLGQQWIDTTQTPPRHYVYLGNEWEEVSTTGAIPTLGQLSADAVFVNETKPGKINLVILGDAIEGAYLLAHSVYPNPSKVGGGFGSQHSDTMREMIVVEPGEELTLTKNTVNNDNFWRINFYGKDNTYISRLATEKNQFMLTVPTNVTKMWVSYPRGSRPQIVRGDVFDYSNAQATYKILQGEEDVTDFWSVTMTPSSSITGVQNGWTYTITALNGNNGYVDFEATREGRTITKRLTVTKVFLGEQGVPGIPGEDSYTWIRYADNAQGSGLSADPSGKTYIGFAYNQTEENPSDDASKYSWSQLQGEQGIPGKDAYTWVRYADSPTSGMNASPNGKDYIGLAFNQTDPNPSSKYKDYAWSRIRGDGTFFHIRYSNDGGKTFTANGGHTVGDWMGTMTSRDEVAPTSVSSYRWVKTSERLEEELEGRARGAVMSPTAPGNPKRGLIWINTSQTPPIYRMWSGSSWINAPEDAPISYPATNGLELADRVTNAEQKITDDSIIQTVMGSTDFSDVVTEFATKGEVNEKADGQEFNDVRGDVDALKNRPAIDLTPFVEATELQQLAQEFNFQVSQSGGVNLIPNSIGYAGFDFWKRIGDIESAQTPELARMKYGSGWRASTSTSQEKSVTQRIYLSGQTGVLTQYTVSAWINIGTQTQTGTTGVQILDSNNTLLSTAGATGTTNGWHRYTHTFRTDKTEVDVKVVFPRNTTGLITGVMLNLGNMPLEWQAHPGEVYNSNVRINLNGIEVSNNQTNGRTVMTPEEFSGYATTGGREERIFTLNGDRTEVKRLLAEEEMTMGSLRIESLTSGNFKGWAFLGA